MLELKDKVSTPVADIAVQGESPVDTGATAEALQALISLGISERQAALAVSAVERSEDMSAEELIKEALKNL